MNGFYSIKIDGEMVGLTFGMPANRWLYEKFHECPDLISGTDINDVGVAWLIYYGYKNNCLITDKTPIISFGKVMEEVMELELTDEGKAILQEVGKVFSESRFTIKYSEDINKKYEEVKKKMNLKSQPTGKKSKASATTN